jgi:hypothetical protein
VFNYSLFFCVSFLILICVGVVVEDDGEKAREARDAEIKKWRGSLRQESEFMGTRV